LREKLRDRLREQLWEKLREKYWETCRSCGEKRNFGHALLGETAGRNFWRNYGRNSGEIIAKIRGGVRNIVWEKMCFLNEFRKPIGHEITKKITEAGRVLAFLQRNA
jgi:hypothetical protein